MISEELERRIANNTSTNINKYIADDYQTLKINYTIMLKYINELEKKLNNQHKEIEHLKRIINYYSELEMNKNEVYIEE